MTETTHTPNASPIPPEVTRLAGQALDLWQNHLAALASDPKAKEDMARLIAPMTQACASWMDMMQQGLRDVNAYPEAQSPHAQQPVSPMSEHTNARSAGRDSFVAGAADAFSRESQRADESMDDADAGFLDVLCPFDLPPRFLKRDEPVLKDAAPSTRGRAASADSGSDLAGLADRLAQLERELDAMRGGRTADADVSDAGDDSDAARMARARMGSTSY